MSAIWIEAESFEELGGWVVDTQSMSQMGSAYVMAHGMGVPVKDARTTINIAKDKTYTVWVRTRDWTAVWKRGTPAGRFQIGFDEELLSTNLGTNGDEWAWQKAGTIALCAGEHSLILHDLTGFNGRCDAIYLTNDENETPCNNFDDVECLRKRLCIHEPEDKTEMYDLAVIGGGIAGICTAITALTMGLKVALIHDREILGGCNSSEIRVSAGGIPHLNPYPNLGNVVSAIIPIMGSGKTYPAEYYEDVRKRNIFELGCKWDDSVFNNERVMSAEFANDNKTNILAVRSRNCRTGKEKVFRAKYFADCSGDALLARLAGAEVMYGREGSDKFGESLAPESADNEVMGMSVLWYSRKENTSTSFPDIDWGIEFTEDNAYYIRKGDWEWETGQHRNQSTDAEYIRDYGLMALYANWSFLKNHSKRQKEWANDSLDWVSYVGGKRESYRVTGDYVLTQNDIEDHREFPDATAAMGWNIDMHFPDPENAVKFKEPFRSCAYHRGIGKTYQVPFRCLYARDVKNLFLGGRHISMTHIAFSCARVMKTLGVLGEVVGLAASICTSQNVLPREIFPKYWDSLKELMTEGVILPIYHPGRSGEVDDHEGYHFKDTGHISVNDIQKHTANSILMERIAILKVKHKLDQ